MANSKRVIAVGDIHGCATAFSTLTAELRPAAEDTLVVLGDAIDRGPDSRGVIDQLRDLQDRCQLICILGNHEQMLLDSVAGKMPQQEWLRFGGAETLDSYRDGAALSAIPDDHIEFVRCWGDCHEIDSHFFVHGNYREDLQLVSQPWEDLRWISLYAYTPARHRSGKTAVLGHTSNKQGLVVNLGHLICIDTFCHGGGWLTAYDATTGQVWQANEAGAFREAELPPVEEGMQF